MIEVLEGHEDVVHGNKHDWIKCPTCHGTGKTPSGRFDCLGCGGIGRIKEENFKTERELDADKKNLKLCKQHRKQMNLTDDYHSVYCQLCRVHDDCPVYNPQEEKKNGKQENPA